jgi:hypothetical protein
MKEIQSLLFKTPILITGTHRSGTTWVGSVLSQSEKVRYIYEPFNIGNRRNAPISNWYENVSYYSANNLVNIKHYLESFLVVNSLGLRNDLKIGFRYFIGNSYNKLTRTTLLKDPIALFSAPFIYNTFGAKVIVMIRHPAAFAASLKVKGWEIDFRNFTRQENFLEEELKTFKESIIQATEKSFDIIDQAILFWNISHYIILKYISKYSNTWLFIRHEDVSSNPQLYFSKMFQYINLPMDNNIQEYITASSTKSGNSRLMRNSLNNILNWRERLSINEIDRIRTGTQELCARLYLSNEW